MVLIAPFDPWASKICTCPRKYSLSPYTGCSHRCVYCYISSYVRDPFNARPKKDFLKRLVRETPRIDKKIPIIIASSSDPYVPLEGELGLTRSTIKVLRDWSARFLLVTKSDLVTRDIDLLRGASAAVSVTITTLDDKLSGKLEPLAPQPDKRLKAVERLNRAGIPCSARVDPIIPEINSEEKGLATLVSTLAYAGVKHITASTYKAKPDSFKRLVQAFPSLEKTLKRLYWEKGETIGGARYLPSDLRLELIRRVKRLVEGRGITFAACREGLSYLHSSATCDSSHLIPTVEETPKQGFS